MVQQEESLRIEVALKLRPSSPAVGWIAATSAAMTKATVISLGRAR